MPVGETLEVVAGTDLSFTQTLFRPDESVYDDFAGSEPLTVSLWAGEDQPPLAPAPTAAWLAPSAGSYVLTVQAAATAALAPGVYRLQVDAATADGRNLVLFNGRLRVVGSSGAATTLPTYCTYRDLRRLFSTIDQLQDPDSDMAGFADERSEARQWLERVGQRHYRTTLAVSQSRFAYFGDGLGIYRAGRDSQWLQQQFDANTLMMTSDVVECVACKSLSIILQGQVEKDLNGIYRARGKEFAIRADALASLLNLQLDINGDGVADVVIPLGSHDRIEG